MTYIAVAVDKRRRAENDRSLTRRETELHRHLLGPNSLKIIAHNMGICVGTVKVMMQRIHAKLGTSTRVELMAKAITVKEQKTACEPAVPSRKLSSVEEKLLRELVYTDKAHKQIAHDVGLTDGTARSYINRLYMRLGAKGGRVELMCREIKRLMTHVERATA